MDLSVIVFVALLAVLGLSRLAELGISRRHQRALARQGMALVLCDIRADSLEVALREVGELQARAVAVETDVSERAAVERAAEAALTAFGAVHIAVNNAGVAMHGVPIESLSPREWDWVMGVNIGGVINGIQVFLPLIRAHGEAGHIVNTASIGGFQVRPGWHTGAYSMTKYAVVALSEELEHDLAGTPIGVSVLCPAGVQSKIRVRAEPARTIRRALYAAREPFRGRSHQGRSRARCRRRACRPRNPRQRILPLHP